MSKPFKIITLVVIPLIVLIYILFLMPAPMSSVPSEANEPSVTPVKDKAEYVPYDPDNPDYAEIDALTADGSVAPDTIMIQQNDVQIETKTEIVFTAAPNNTDVPSFYNRLILPGVLAPVYAFENEEHMICYRSWGSYWKLINNIRTENLEGFFPVVISMSVSGKYSIQASSEKPVADQSSLSSAKQSLVIPDSIPANYYPLSIDPPVYTVFDKNLNQDYRIFCVIEDTVRCYPCDIQGNIYPGSLPVDPDTESQYLLDNFTFPEDSTVTEEHLSYPSHTDDDLILTVIPSYGGHNEK